MLKAGSLFYALILMLLVGTVLSILLITSGTDKLIKTKLALENEFIDFNKSSIAYALANFSELDSTNTTVQPFNDDFRFSVKSKKWGFLDVLYCNSFYISDTIKKIAFVGTSNSSNLALYLSDYDKPLYLFNTTIRGNCKLPKSGINQLQINNGKSGKNHIIGKISTATNKLPSFKKKVSLNNLSGTKVNYKDLLSKSKWTNPFENETVWINMKGIIDVSNIELSGKFILKSSDSICIKKTAKLNNVIIQSPKVSIASGFKGSIQIFASENVLINEHVVLQSPSFIQLKNEIRMQDAGITISSNSYLEGGILVFGKTGDVNFNFLNIEKDALVAGIIYCKGKTSLQGKIQGTIYTNKFYLDTGDAKYSNAIKDGEIHILPAYYAYLDFGLQTNINFEVIKWLP